MPHEHRWHVDLHVFGLRLAFTVGPLTDLLGFGRQHGVTG